MAGILGDMLGWGTNPIYKGFDTRRNAVTGLGMGLLQGDDWQSGLAKGVGSAWQGGQIDQVERQRQEELAKAQEQKNATAAYLRAQGRDDLAQAMEMGALTGGDAFKTWYNEANAPAAKPQYQEVGGKLVQINPDGTVAEAYDPYASTGGMNPKDAFSNESDLWKQYRSGDAVKSYEIVRNGYEKVRASAALDSGPGDMSLIFGYMKMLDPTSVVREGEFATAQNSGGIAPQILNLYNQALTGERLPPEQRQAFVQAADALYKEVSSNIQDYNAQFTSRIPQGIDASRIIVQPETYGAGDPADPLGIR